MSNINIPLTYYPVKLNNTELVVEDTRVGLYENGKNWMGLDLITNWQASEFVFELNQASGICITTGLGLGILQTLLCLNTHVTQVKVFEKNQSVIDIFLHQIKKNNFDISKLEIVNFDANDLRDSICDCLFLDHFEHEPENEIINCVKKISENNTCNLLWYWPCVRHFTLFCNRNRLKINNDSFLIWKDVIGVKNLPNNLTENQFALILNLSNYYRSKAKNNTSLEVINQRNKLLSIFGSKK